MKQFLCSVKLQRLLVTDCIVVFISKFSMQHVVPDGLKILPNLEDLGNFKVTSLLADHLHDLARLGPNTRSHRAASLPSL